VISVIIPTLNAAPYLPRALAPLVRATADGLVKQVIVADGGSQDETLPIAEAAGCDIVVSTPGRGRQMHAGAAVAKGRWFLFLHADTELSEGWADEARRFITQPSARHKAAAFRLAFDDDSAAARRVVYWARQRARWLKLPYGDQGLLISRFLYEAVGGYPDIPIMEDVEMARRIGRHRLALLETPAVTSAEKYRRDGFGKRAWRNLGLTARYLLGADPVELAKVYD
jgi:rSAM/selenodomain-associated transferase 2